MLVPDLTMGEVLEQANTVSRPCSPKSERVSKIQVGETLESTLFPSILG